MPSPTSASAPAQLTLALADPPAPTLDNYVAGANALALAALRAAIAGRSPATVIYLWGEAGSGRTHLLDAVAACGLPTADDVDRLDEPGQIALFDAINAARARSVALVAAGVQGPAQLAVREDLRTRLGSGLAFELRALSESEKTAALAAHARARGLKLGADVIAYLLTHLRRDMGTQIAMLDALDRYSLAAKRPVTLPLVRQALAALGTD